MNFSKKISNILMLKMCLSGWSFCDLPSAILAKLNSATTFLASITLYVYNNITIIFQFKTKVKTRENRSAIRWQLLNRPWFVAWADGDGSKGEVQNKFCYILQNKNQKNYWGDPDPLGPPVDTPLIIWTFHSNTFWFYHLESKLF